jgi:hypothetical protein
LLIDNTAKAHLPGPQNPGECRLYLAEGCHLYIALTGTDRFIEVMELATMLRRGLQLPPELPQSLDVQRIHESSPSAFPNGCHPVPAKTNPLGAKGCGEAGCAGSLPAVMNAVVDALSEYGIRHIDMPATPHRIWQAIQQARSFC